MGRRKVGEKSNEITALPELLADIKPHLNRYWLTPAYEADFDTKVIDINGLYKQAPELAQQGQRFESV